MGDGISVTVNTQKITEMSPLITFKSERGKGKRNENYEKVKTFVTNVHFDCNSSFVGQNCVRIVNETCKKVVPKKWKLARYSPHPLSGWQQLNAPLYPLRHLPTLMER